MGMCCGDKVLFGSLEQFHLFEEFHQFANLKWPVLSYSRTWYKKRRNVIMVHAPVGNDILFNNNNKCKVIVSGFSTSPEATNRYIEDKFITKMTNEKNLEMVHTFNSSGLKTNINKMLSKLGILTYLNIKNAFEFVGETPEFSKDFPIWFTQMVCCNAVLDNNERVGSSNAEDIIKTILNQSHERQYDKGCKEKTTEHRAWVGSCLKDWLTKIHEYKDDNCILILLGYSKKSAIQRLLTYSYIDKRNMEIKFSNEGTDQSLLQYIKDIFEDRVLFVPHPSQLTDTRLNNFINSPDGMYAQKVINKYLSIC